MINRIMFFFLLVFSVNANAQAPAVTDVTDGLLTWVKRLDSDFSKYYKQEKSAQLKESLGFLKQDLEDYMKTRKRLSDSLFRHNVPSGKKDPENLEALKIKMGAVMGRMREVTDLTNRELQAEGDKLNDAIYNVLYGESNQFLSHLEAFLAGYEVTKKDMALDGSTCYSRLQTCLGLINGLQDKIDRKK
ncbi:hypothetical protein [Chitinophaga cymbidii]|uniref:Uncharacterized protein n=1 Tax=Chitinophaga cymbidii TaxID=1096750 RepID=A0A512RQV1_9BACT|nr:hypothetical protein [Chitinophaga cymbidii]GEP98050.1 hypothetical protein CCY01nite_43100 [Chitinophaga cymbidii]